MISQATGLPCRFGTSFFCGRWWGSIVHVIHLNTDSRRWGWLEYRGPSSLITNLACVVDASSLFKLILQFTNLTVLPCFLDGILPFPTTCGPSGTRRRWDFKVNFVAVILWTNSHRLSLKLRLRHNWWLSESKITSWINNWGYRLRHISSTFNSFCHSTNPRSIHIHLSPQLQCLNHQHRWHLSPHHRVPMQPSMLKRWCNRWRTQWSPACKRSWSSVFVYVHIHIHDLFLQAGGFDLSQWGWKSDTPAVPRLRCCLLWAFLVCCVVAGSWGYTWYMYMYYTYIYISYIYIYHTYIYIIHIYIYTNSGHTCSCSRHVQIRVVPYG